MKDDRLDFLVLSFLEKSFYNYKTLQQKRATCFATLLQNERESDVAGFTTLEKKNPFNLTCSKSGSNVGSKTRNIAIQFVLHQCCKTSCTFLLSDLL